MKFRAQIILSMTVLCLIGTSQAATLREAFEAAGPGDGFEKLLTLETGQVYTGGLHIGPTLPCYSDKLVGDAAVDTKIVGNGAILDLQGEQIIMSYCNEQLVIEDCIVLNGNIRYRGLTWSDIQVLPRGAVRNVTFYKPHDYGVRFQRSGPGITLERNLVVDPVNTGNDFIYITGIASEWLPTGACFSPAIAVSMGLMRENWTWFSNPKLNADPLYHFMLLCNYG
jgi:hypothetical protein